MIAMTTSKSTSVKAVLRSARFMISLDKRKVDNKPPNHGDNTEVPVARPQFLANLALAQLPMSVFKQANAASRLRPSLVLQMYSGARCPRREQPPINYPISQGKRAPRASTSHPKNVQTLLFNFNEILFFLIEPVQMAQRIVNE